MKYMMVLIAAVVAINASADVILYDPFDDGNLSTSTNGMNGGFTVIGTGGTAEETGGIARISNAPNGSDFGILSAGTVSLTGAPALRTTWTITNSDLKNNANALVFVWQLESDLNSLDPDLALVLDLNLEEAYFYTDGAALTNDSLSASFGQVGDAFIVTATFSPSAGTISGSGALKTKAESTLNLSVPWGEEVPALTALHVGAFANGKGNEAMVIEFDSVTVETIPEPAVISLIGLFGGGMIFTRRIFGRKKSDFDA